jgi:uncharacterized protein YcnI
MNIELNVKKILALITAVGALVLPATALAHVTVKPAEVGVGQRVNFVVSVPTEEDNPTTEVRLVMPAGLKSVRPNAKAGWNIEIKRIGESMKGPILNTGQPAPDPETVIEIVWSGGSIPAEMRDEFVFSAQAPADQVELQWKAYQTYSDRKVVSWDKSSSEVEAYSKATPAKQDEHDENAPMPYSTTKVINDLSVSPKPEGQVMTEGDKISRDNMPLILAVLAVVLSGISLGIALRKK